MRGGRLDHLQVWDHRRERGGFVDACRRCGRTGLEPKPTRPTCRRCCASCATSPAAEALGIGVAAAYLKAAPAARWRRGRRRAVRRARHAGRAAGAARVGRHPSTALSRGPTSRPASRETAPAHLDVVPRYGVALRSFERDGALHHLLRRRRVPPRPRDAPRPRRAAGARALALTRPDCIDPALAAAANGSALDGWRSRRPRPHRRRAGVALPRAPKNRIAHAPRRRLGGDRLRPRARGRAGCCGKRRPARARRARRHRRDALADDDVAARPRRRSASARRAGRPMPPPSHPATRNAAPSSPDPGEPGQTCVALLEMRRIRCRAALVKRCT